MAKVCCQAIGAVTSVGPSPALVAAGTRRPGTAVRLAAVDYSELAKRVNDVAQIQGEFLLRSGLTTNTYFDKYQFEASPTLLRDICIATLPLLPDGTRVLAGLEMGGIPIATVLSQLTGLPAAFVRKAPKTYGTCRYAEGAAH